MKHLFNAFNMAISMFTVIPLPKYIWEEKSAKYIMRIYPLVGLIIGLIWYGVGVILNYFEVNIMLSSAILLAVSFLITGFIHLDGFMDVSDALLSRRPKEDKLRILKDSRVGAFAVISLVLLFIVEFASIFSMLDLGVNLYVLVFIPIISRTIAGYFIISNNPIGESYYGKLFKDGTGKFDKIILLAIFSLIITSNYFLGNRYIIMPLIMLAIAFLLLRNCLKELGGINGDVAGYILVLSELSGIITLAII